MKDLSFLETNTIAHRGLFNNKDIPENSIKAFENAIKNKYIIELDVHIIKDGNIVVFHDDNLKRMTGLNRNIENLNYKELSKLKLLSTSYSIPTLKEVLKLVNGKVPIIVELKVNNKSYKLEKSVSSILDKYNGKFVIKSFNSFSIYWFKKNKPEFIRGILISDKKRLYNFLNKRLFLKICKPDFLSCQVKLYNDKKIINYKKNNCVLGWTIRNKKNFDKYSKYFSNLICENKEGNKLWEKKN